MADEQSPFPDSEATDVTRVRGIEIPSGHGYERHEQWSWVEVSESGYVSTFLLELTVSVEPPEPSDDSDNDGNDST